MSPFLPLHVSSLFETFRGYPLYVGAKRTQGNSRLHVRMLKCKLTVAVFCNPGQARTSRGGWEEHLGAVTVAVGEPRLRVLAAELTNHGNMVTKNLDPGNPHPDLVKQCEEIRNHLHLSP